MLLARSITYTFFLLCSLWAISCQVVSKPFQSSRIKELAAYCDTIIDTLILKKIGHSLSMIVYPCYPFEIDIKDFYYIPHQEQPQPINGVADSIKLCNKMVYIEVKPIPQYYKIHSVYTNITKNQHKKRLLDSTNYSSLVLVKQGDLFWSDGCQWKVDSIYVNFQTEHNFPISLPKKEIYLRFILVDCLSEFENKQGQCKCAVKNKSNVRF